MVPMHLDSDTYQRLRAGKLDPATARLLAEHLEAACEVCEAFLVTKPTDGLDGAVDAALTRLAPASPDEAGRDLEYFLIERRAFPRRVRLARAARWASAAAALLLVGGVSVTVLRHRGSRDEKTREGEKGPPQAIPARLRFAVIGAAGAPQIDRGQSGAVVPEGASLAFRVELGRAAYVALLRIGPGESEVVWRQYVPRPGPIDVSERGRPAAYPLHGLAGTQRFALVASERPLEEEDLAAAARMATGASARSQDPRWTLMTLDVVEVTVR